MLTELNKVAIISSEFPPEPGGIGNHAFNLAKQLSFNSFNVTVVTDKRSNDSNNFDENQLFVIRRIALRNIRLIMYFERFFKVLKEVYKNDIIIASGKFSLWIVAFYSLFFKKKTIAVIHGTEVNFSSKILKRSINFSLKKFDTVIAVSNYTKKFVNNLKLKESLVIPNGFNPSKQKEEINKPNHLNLITVGSVTERKGQKNIIKMLPELLKKYPNAHYHIVGIPKEKENYQVFAKKIGVDKYITFHGKVSEEKKVELLLSSTIFMMLSNQTKTGDVEGFGIAILEANQFGIPAIGTKNSGISDAIDNNVSGILVDDVKDSVELINAVDNVIKNYNNFQKNAKIKASKYTWNKVINQYLKVLKS